MQSVTEAVLEWWHTYVSVNDKNIIFWKTNHYTEQNGKYSTAHCMEYNVTQVTQPKIQEMWFCVEHYIFMINFEFNTWYIPE